MREATKISVNNIFNNTHSLKIPFNLFKVDIIILIFSIFRLYYRFTLLKRLTPDYYYA